MDEIDQSLFAKKKGGIFKDVDKQKQIAFMEVQIYKYIDILDEQVNLIFICLNSFWNRELKFDFF